MRTLTLKLPSEIAAKLDKLAEKRGVTKSWVARQAIEKEIKRADKDIQLSAYDLMKDRLGVIDSGVGDLSYNKKHMKGYGK